MAFESDKPMAKCDSTHRALRYALVLFVAAWMTGCSAGRYRQSADSEVYSIISKKSLQVSGM